MRTNWLWSWNFNPDKWELHVRSRGETRYCTFLETHVVGTIIASNWEVMLTSGLRGSNYGEQRLEVKFNVEIKMIPLSINLITFTDYMGVPIRIHVTFHDYVSSVRMVCGSLVGMTYGPLNASQYRRTLQQQCIFK